MSFRVLRNLLFFALAAGCGRGSGSSQPETADAARSAAEAAEGCSVLTAADIKAVTGADVHLIARGSTAGAGGTCGNYATPDSTAYLGVNALQSASAYESAVAAVPEDIYPKRQPLAGLGDQAVLMKDDTGMLRYLVARKGNRGVVLFPLGSGVRGISDDQLRQLAAKAIAAQ
jgi:hypothetical protein